MCLISAVIFCFNVVTVLAAPEGINVAPAIIGGDTVTRIIEWPYMANVMFTWNLATYEQFCGGAILSERTIITSAQCINLHPASRFRLRVASALASNGGSTKNVDSLLPHPFYNPQTEDHDFGLIRTAVNMTFTTQIQPANIADINYKLADNEIVRALGWGAEKCGGQRSEQLREVQIFTINQQLCAKHYNTKDVIITDNMLCAGWLYVSGRGQCQGDTGGPLFHNDVLVGVYSFGISCGIRFFPGVNARVSRASEWINANK